MSFTLDDLRAKMLKPTAPSNSLKEFSPRKAKFGFKIDSVELFDIPTLAELLEFMKPAPLECYNVEFGVPYRGRTTVFKLYINDDAVAAGVRERFITSI